MSWLRSALNRASEVTGVGSAATGGKPSVLNASAKSNYLAGRVKQYAGVVVQRAGDVMAGGAKLVMERTGTAKNLNNLKHAVRRLDEVSRTARGKERTEALTRWLGALRELGKGGKLAEESTGAGLQSSSLESTQKAPNTDGETDEQRASLEPPRSSSDPLVATESSGTGGRSLSASLLEPTTSKEPSLSAGAGHPGQAAGGHIASSVLFYDVESGDEPFTFRDVFLRSHALENIVMSLVKEPPTPQDTQLVSELLNLCMMGTQDMHSAFLRHVVDLSEAYATYSEVKLNQEELLQMVATAVTGMKHNSEAERLEMQVAKLKGQLDSLDHSAASSVTQAFSLSLKLADASRQLEAIVTQQGDDEGQRTSKIGSAQSISVELLSKIPEFESRVKECQQQLQDSVRFRGSKAEEVIASEKVISEELQVLHKRRMKLEEELEQVMSAISAATRRHLEIQEEKEQFDLVSSSIASRLSVEEEGLNVLIRQHKDDAKVLTEWGIFLEETWKLQGSSREGGEKEAKDAGVDAQDRLWKIAVRHLDILKDEATRCWQQYKMERAKLEESVAFATPDQEPENLRRGLPADEGYRLADFRLKNALREVEKAKAEIAVRTSGMADPGEGEKKAHYSALLQIINEVDEMRKEYTSLPRVRPVADASPVSE